MGKPMQWMGNGGQWWAMVSNGEQWAEVANQWIDRGTPSAANEAASSAQPRRAECLNDLVLNSSSLSRAIAVRYTEELVRRYAARPSVFFWERGLDWALVQMAQHVNDDVCSCYLD